jgi:hypothetical protein
LVPAAHGCEHNGIPGARLVIRFLNIHGSCKDPMTGGRHLTPKCRSIVDIHRCIMHVIDEAVPTVARNVLHRNKKYRVKLLMNQINQKKFKELIGRSEKAARKIEVIVQVLETMELIAGDIFRNLILRTDYSLDPHAPDRTLALLLDLAKQFNSGMVPISKRYNCVVPIVDERTWIMTKEKIETQKVDIDTLLNYSSSSSSF